VSIPWVVKLGGSFTRTDALPRWLDALAVAGVVVVPGGGPFADAVRDAQGRWRFDDATAHAMAIHGMIQFGLMLCGVCPRLRPAPDFATLKRSIAAGFSTVWLPDAALLEQAGVPASWDVTSDSLAAWLTQQLQAHQLLLIKSARIPTGDTGASHLVAEGLLDIAFPRMTEDSSYPIWLSGPHAADQLQAGIHKPEDHFTAVIRC
jgi:aspartokinase-like uncharacterized kinase